MLAAADRGYLDAYTSYAAAAHTPADSREGDAKLSELRNLIRQVAADNPDAPPADLVELVIAATPPKQVLDYYRTAVRNDVFDVLRLDRNTALVAASTGRPARRPSPSWKVAHTRSWWQEMLDGWYKTADGQKRYGDCTVIDLDYIIKERRSHISDVEYHIRIHERHRDQMISLGVDRVRDLPEQQPE